MLSVLKHHSLDREATPTCLDCERPSSSNVSYFYNNRDSFTLAAVSARNKYKTVSSKQITLDKSILFLLPTMTYMLKAQMVHSGSSVQASVQAIWVQNKQWLVSLYWLMTSSHGDKAEWSWPKHSKWDKPPEELNEHTWTRAHRFAETDLKYPLSD